MVNFNLTAQQADSRSRFVKLGQEVFVGLRANYEKLPTQYERFYSLLPSYTEAVKRGILRSLIHTKYGGSGSMLEAALLVEETYAIDVNACLTLVATSLGLGPLLRGGTPEQQKKFLTPFLQLEGAPVCSLVHSEPGGTANWLTKGGNGLQVTSRRDGDFMVVNGRKTWASNSSGWTDQGADLQCLVTREIKTLDTTQDPNANPADAILVLLITPEIIAQNDPGAYKVLEHLELPGHIAMCGPLVEFTNLRVPISRILGTPGKPTAAAVVESFMDSGALVGAAAVGNMRTVYEEALKFAKTDTRGGAQPIIHHQSVSNLLANIKMRTDASRLLVWKACDDLDKEKGWELAVEAKIFPTECAVKNVNEAMAAVGMMAYSKDTEFPRLLNDAVVLPLFDGGNYGIRRRQLEHIMVAADYDPWATLYQQENLEE
ncbi:hypothetical protein ACHAP3_000730 [Botrytis cinerea]